MPETPIPESVQKFRARIRPEAIGPHYVGWAHFAFTSVGALLVVGFSAAQVRAPTWGEWLMIPVSFVIADGAEYFAHRFAMHRRRKGLGLIYKRHTQEHHHFFTHEAMGFESRRDFKMVLFPPIMMLFFLGGIATPIGLLCYFLISPNAGWLFAAIGLGYFLLYEWLHFSYHLPEGSWLARLPVMGRLRAHHVHHHNLSLMGKWNFNITFPLWDTVMGTTYRRSAPSPAPPPTIAAAP